VGEVIDGERQFDFRITDAFLQSTLVDVLDPYAPSTRYTFGSPALIPRWRKDMADVHRPRRRIDFIFSDEKTARSTVTAQIVTDDATVGRWSDHYPIRMTIER